MASAYQEIKLIFQEAAMTELQNDPIVLTIENDPQYGTFWMECIGIVDHYALLMLMDFDEYQSWTHTYHPFTYFTKRRGSALEQHQLHDHVDHRANSIFRGRYAIFTCTERVNTNWDFRGCKYGKEVGGRKRKMPLIGQEKHITKWQQSLSDGLLTPTWMEGCKTFSDLKTAHDRAHAGICEHCEQIANRSRKSER
jgi:hypothetical protein